MALETQDMELIVATMSEIITEVVTREISKVEAQITRLRQEMTDTVQVLDGNDQAVVAMVQERISLPPTEYVKMANQAWERFITREAEIVASGKKQDAAIKKKAKTTTDEGDAEVEG